MSEFMLLFRGGEAPENESQEEKQAQMQRWGKWIQSLSEAGAFVSGSPLTGSGKVVFKRGEVMTDGPFAEGKEIVGGYIIVNATDLDHAAEIAKGSPIFNRDGCVEVRPSTTLSEESA